MRTRQGGQQRQSGTQNQTPTKKATHGGPQKSPDKRNATQSGANRLPPFLLLPNLDLGGVQAACHASGITPTREKVSASDVKLSASDNIVQDLGRRIMSKWEGMGQQESSEQ